MCIRDRVEFLGSAVQQLDLIHQLLVQIRGEQLVQCGIAQLGLGLICLLYTSSKHIFTQGAVSGNCCFKMIQLLTAAALPVKVRSRKVRRLSGIAFYKNFTAMIARAKRRQF